MNHGAVQMEGRTDSHHTVSRQEGSRFSTTCVC